MLTDDTNGVNDDGVQNPSLPPLPPSPSKRCRNFISRQLSLSWEFAVNSIADFIAAILSHPKVQASFNQLLLVAVTAVLEDPDGFIINKLDAATRHYTEDFSRHSVAARQIGKDAPKLVGGFVGGLLSNVKLARSNNNKNDNKHNHTGQTVTQETGGISSSCDGSIEQMYFDDPKKDK
ncbi:hypothetical protein MHU86_7127 [Fragilaria crotonensis]|nr:hypothetical protein MHU86_7127 [Fragilaria crotonensis]